MCVVIEYFRCKDMNIPCIIRHFDTFFLRYSSLFFFKKKKYRKKVRKSDRLKRFILNFAANFNKA